MPSPDFAIPSIWQLPDEFRRRLGTTVGRQRLMVHEEQLLLVAHDVPEASERRRRGLLFWRDADKQWHASNGDPGEVALSILVEKYSKRLEQFDAAEVAALKSTEYLPLLEGLTPLGRSARNLYELLAEARRAVPDCRELIDARDAAYEMSRNAELLYQDAKNAMDIAIIRQAEEQAKSSEQMSVASHRLNLMAAIFFPLATLGGIFGTTLTDGWSWSQTAAPFILFLIVGLISGAILVGFVGKKA